jgi:hypothetical protein
VTAEEQLNIAKNQLAKVQAAWFGEPDWDDLSLYGFYCLENAVCAAATHAGISFTRSHRGKVAVALTLTAQYGFPDISELLVNLNDARKASAYGDIDSPDLDAESVALAIEEYVGAVESFLAK